VRHIPLLGVVVALYLIVAAAAPTALDQPLFGLTLPSGTEWSFTPTDLLLALGLVALYIEILKATRTGHASIADHVISLTVFVAAMLCFILVPRAGRTGFALLTLMSFIDVIAGFTVTITAARRDIDLDRDRL
jgi:hypothetical protein